MNFKQLARFLTLPPEERSRLAWAVIHLAGAAMSLRLLGLRRTRALLQRMEGGRRSGPAADDPATPAREALAIDRASRGIGIGTCLSKSLALQLLLRRRGIEVELRLGVARRSDSILEAHAWLERDGAAIGPALGRETGYRALQPSARLDRPA